MTVLIIEDEKPAAEKLRQALAQSGQGVEVIGQTATIQETLDWLKNNPAPQLIFSDIALTDGLSFRIFEQFPVNCPVIFVTAYDEYWQEAFECNAIDYLLKPLNQDKLEATLVKYKKLEKHFSENLQNLLQWPNTGPEPTHKKRWLVKRGNDYLSVKTEDIAYLYAVQKLVCLVNKSGEKFILDKSLNDFEKELDPRQFFRVSRKFLVQVNAIDRLKAASKGKLQVLLNPPVEEEIMVSQETAPLLKAWLEN